MSRTIRTKVNNASSEKEKDLTGTQLTTVPGHVKRGLDTSVIQSVNVDLELARLHVPGKSADFFFGHNTALQNGVFEDVHAQGGDINWLTTAGRISFASSHLDDDISGLGVRQLEIHGLSATGVDQSEVVDMDGLTQVHTTLSYIRMNLLHNESVGTYGGSHRGDITARVFDSGSGSGAILGVMNGKEGSVNGSVQYGYGELQAGYTSVPLGKVLYITRIEVVPNSSKPIDVVLYEREGILNISGTMEPRRVIWAVDDIELPIEKEFKSHIKIKQLTDLFFRAEGDATVGGVEVWCDFYLLDRDSSGA